MPRQRLGRSLTQSRYQTRGRGRTPRSRRRPRRRPAAEARSETGRRECATVRERTLASPASAIAGGRTRRAGSGRGASAFDQQEAPSARSNGPTGPGGESRQAATGRRGSRILSGASIWRGDASMYSVMRGFGPTRGRERPGSTQFRPQCNPVDARSGARRSTVGPARSCAGHVRTQRQLEKSG